MKQKIIYLAVIIVVALIGIRIYVTSTNKHTASAVVVAVSPVVKDDISVTVQAIGTVEAYSSVELKSMVTGPLQTVNFKEGDTVTAGQVLFVIDQRSFESAVSQAEANLMRDQATLAKEEATLKRNSQLVKQGYTSKQDYDTLVANVKVIEATVSADKALLENAKLQLEYATIRAPITGKTGNISLKLGSVIKANDTTALVTIRQIKPIYVVFTIPQSKLPLLQERLKQGPLKVKATITSARSEEGELSFIDNSMNTQTGTIGLKAVFPNEEERLWPGQYVTIDLPIEQMTGALVIPSLALLTGQQGFYVYVVDQASSARMVSVKPGATVGNKTVIEDGLKPGERVVTAGQLRLYDGALVEVR